MRTRKKTLIGVVHVRFRPTAKVLRIWAKDAKHTGRTPNVAYFGARMPKQPRRFREFNKTWGEMKWAQDFADAIKHAAEVLSRMPMIVTAIEGTASARRYTFEVVHDGR
jgi:hypothetical protein